MKNNSYILSRLLQYEVFSLQQSNEIARLKAALAEAEKEVQSYKELHDADVELLKENEDTISSLTKERDDCKAQLEDTLEKYANIKIRNEELDAKITSLETQVANLADADKVLEVSKTANMDLKALADVLRKHLFGQHSDATRFLKGEFTMGGRDMEELSLEDFLEGIGKKL